MADPFAQALAEQLASHVGAVSEQQAALAGDQALVARFMAKVHVDATRGCWFWTASTRRGGYGQFSISGRPVSAHRAAFILFRGLGPGPSSRLCVCHRCDTPACVNPDHLFLGTAAENSADMVLKGRANNSPMPGESNPNAKLSADDVRRLREDHASGMPTWPALARKYGISATLARMVATGRAWRSVGKGPVVAHLGLHYNSRKTHCKRGHPLAGDNLGRSTTGRLCRACERERHQRKRARR